MSQGQQKKQLELLKREYNAALTRYKKMCEWVETASEEEQQKYGKDVIDVINTCNSLLNEIKKIDRLVAPTEILYGFKELM